MPADTRCSKADLYARVLHSARIHSAPRSGWGALNVNKLLLRLRTEIFPPKYPEYGEYRDEDEDAGDHVVDLPRSSDDMEVKITRLRLSAGFVIVLSIGVAVYLYTQDKEARLKAGLKSPLAADMLQDALPEEQLAPRNSLDEIQRWAQEVEAEAQQTAGDPGAAAIDTMGRSAALAIDPSSNGPAKPGSFAPIAPYEPSTASTSNWTVPEAASGSETSSSSATALSWPPTPTPPSSSSSNSSSAASAPSPPATAPSSSAGAVATPSNSPAAAPPSPVKSDTPAGRYAPKRYEPVTLEPRNVEPY